jgi:hypothetical protein
LLVKAEVKEVKRLNLIKILYISKNLPLDYNFEIMTKNKIDLRISVIVALILIVALSRLTPIYNFSPLGALGLFGAAYFKRKWQVFLIPIAAIWISDVLVNNVLYSSYYSSFTWVYDGFYWQYGSYLLIALVGLFIFKKVNATRVLAGALSATVLFFFVSNFGSWASSPLYPKSFAGLMSAFAAGIPFIKGTLLGNLIYSGVLFGSFALLQRKFPVLRFAKQETVSVTL